MEGEAIRRRIRVGSRGSRLAVIQAEIVMRQMEEIFPDVSTELVTFTTTGDRIQDRPLDRIGGKGLFVRELDEALASGEVDMTVHSLKDLPQELPEGLPIAAYSVREDPRDVLILPEGRDEPDLSLPIGTSSMRRSIQIRELYRDAVTAPVRGNVETRLRKLDEGQYSALVMAAAGIKRIGLEHRISRSFEPVEMLPAACQGIMAVQIREGDTDLAEMLRTSVNDADAECCAVAERAYIREIGADCGSPDTVYAYIVDGLLQIFGFRYDAEYGAIKDAIAGYPEEAETLGRTLARRLRDAAIII